MSDKPGAAITIDEALLAAKNNGNCDEDCVTAELAAEVERLRAEVETAGLAYRNLFANMQKLEAENAELRARQEACKHANDPVAELQRCQFDFFDLARESRKLKARLAWFEETWPFVQAIVDADYDDIEHQDALLDRLRANPRPGS